MKPPMNMVWRPGIVSVTKCRKTGTLVVVARAEAFCDDVEAGAWVTVCLQHGGICHHPTRTMAQQWASDPECWCPTCQGEDVP